MQKLWGILYFDPSCFDSFNLIQISAPRQRWSRPKNRFWLTRILNSSVWDYKIDSERVCSKSNSIEGHKFRLENKQWVDLKALDSPFNPTTSRRVSWRNFLMSCLMRNLEFLKAVSPPFLNIYRSKEYLYFIMSGSLLQFLFLLTYLSS